MANNRFLVLRRVLIAFLMLAWQLPAAVFAEEVVVTRHVTIREAPIRSSPFITYPQVGDTLTLLDDGARQRGYYHVQLPDGRTGWVYYSFVRRIGGGAGPSVALDGANRLIVHFIDVDQGSAALVETPCGAVMIDVGGRDAAAGDHLLDYLTRFFERRPDLSNRLAAIFVTHTHIDHNRFLRRVAERFQIGGYIHNGILSGSGRAGAGWMARHVPEAMPPIQPVAVSQAMVIAAGPGGLTDDVIDPLSCTGVDPRIRVLSGRYDENPGWSDGEHDNGNNQSLVIRLDYGNASFLFTGDLEEAAIDTLVEHYDGTDMLDVDVYVAGHHGSHNGTTEGLVRATTPEIGIISMGSTASQASWTAYAYGHPRRAAVALIDAGVSRRRGAPRDVQVGERARTFTTYDLTDAIYATGWDGDLMVTAGADGALIVSGAD